MIEVQEKIEVRYQETDQMGVVYHGNYLVWFEIGRTKYLENLGLKYIELEGLGYYSPVIDINISYRKAVKYGQEVTIKTSLESYDGIRTVYSYKIFDDKGDLAVTGKSTHVVVRKDTFSPVLMRKVYPHWHQVFIDRTAADK